MKEESENPYVKGDKPFVPVGVINLPYEYKNGEVPEEDIVKIPIDPLSKIGDERQAINILILGGQGDGKTLLEKVFWGNLVDAGWYCLFIDPAKTSSGRARLPFNGKGFFPPHLNPKGIKLKHYMPSFVIRDYPLTHNFNVYSIRLKDIDEKYMWMGLGATSTGASKITNIIRNNPYITAEGLREELNYLRRDDSLNASALTSMRSKISDLEELGYLDQQYEELNLLNDWKEGYSVCISYNATERVFMSFDIGMKIKKCREYFSKNNNRIPIMIFFDDSGFYADRLEGVQNYAIEEIKKIGFQYRGLGIYNCMAVQTLGIIDHVMAEGYTYKIITPKFDNIDSLEKIGVPKEAIDKLKKEPLFQDKENNITQMMLITPERDVKVFYPFTPRCEHFREVYHYKK